MIARGYIVALTLGLAACSVEPPDFATVKNRFRPSEAYLLDRHGALLHVSRIDYAVRRTEWMPLAELSSALPAAIIAGEDRRFREHHGVDWRSLARAGFDTATGRGRRGASTLAMQVATLVDPTLAPGPRGRTAMQKLRQIAAAIAIERRWSKAQILEAYLNLADFRGETTGIGAASAYLLGKHPSGIDALDAALLAALLPAPNTSARRLARRACAVATYLTPPADCARLKAAAERLSARLAAPLTSPAYAPELARRLLRTPGERVATTLDLELQRAVRAALTSQLGGMNDRNVRDGAVVVLDNATGDVLAYVGSAGPHSTARNVDGVSALRQAGSTLKPFLYGIALDRGLLTAASILDDSPLALDTGAGLYIPQNYDRDFKGSVSARTALAASLNVPAVRTLMLVGVDRFRDELRSFGYRSLNEDGEFYGYSLALGSADVSLLEQANAYRMLANGGRLGAVRFVTRRMQPPIRVISEAAAFIIADILSDRASRAPSFGLDSALATRYWSAVKTGTSKDMRDNWCIGFSNAYTVGVWVGNFEGDSMHDVSGVTGAAPVWLSIMNRLHDVQTTAERSRASPVGIVSVPVRFEPPIEPARSEWFVAGTALSTVRAVDASHRPQLVSPANGLVVALDPDIPLSRQMLTMAARGTTRADTLTLDGRLLGSADTVHRVPPVPGRHVLRLLARDARVVDEVHYRVRSFPTLATID